jgi:methionyl-tRNA formyltransferase
LRLIFAGTPEFARVALAQLQAAGFEIALVLTQPDRPAGRGLKLQPSAVKQQALTHGLPLAQPRSLRLDGRYPEDAQAARAAIGLEASERIAGFIHIGQASETPADRPRPDLDQIASHWQA